MSRFCATLYGFIRLAPTQDCIGIPVFREPGMNFDLVAEMDPDLKISRFIELLPEQGYHIEPLPQINQRRYSVGEAAPIPFLVQGKGMVIGGDRYPSDVSFSSDVADSVRELLQKARSGFFHEQLERWKTEDVMASYADLFEERPSNAKYWITRYRSAISHSRKEGKMPAALADQFRKVGMRWLNMFATKTGPDRLRLLFGNVTDEVFSRDDVEAACFAHLCHRYTLQENRYLRRVLSGDGWWIGVLPEGIYYYYLRHGFPRVSFGYHKPDDLLAPFRHDLLQSKVRSLGVSSDFRWKAVALFGTRDAPVQLQGILNELRKMYNADYFGYKGSIEKLLDPAHITRSSAMEAVGYIPALERSLNSLIELEAIEYGDARLAPRENDFLAYEKGYVENLKITFMRGDG